VTGYGNRFRTGISNINHVQDFNDVIVLISSTPDGRCNRICPAMADISKD
jgi:hypothetical protein